MGSPPEPHWRQPSHPALQEVQMDDQDGFRSKSVSRISLAPFGLFAQLSSPPCSAAEGPSYATVQIGREQHLHLNSDLVYLNHACEPSLIVDTCSLSIKAGPQGLKPGQELTFFYPSTEWHMAQPFDCLCGASSCRGRISGAGHMSPDQLEGVWLNGHIRDMLAEQRDGTDGPTATGSAAAEHAPHPHPSG